ncbi:hypothetical protein FQR65_LT20298 [Abscondita terminalis]|nr:hypothetical protein FQR65_LT20298 [Abscondita terminalis]
MLSDVPSRQLAKPSPYSDVALRLKPLADSPVLESNPLSSLKNALVPDPRSSLPITPQREALFCSTLTRDWSPVFWDSTVVLTRPYIFNDEVCWAKAVQVEKAANAMPMGMQRVDIGPSRVGGVVNVWCFSGSAAQRDPQPLQQRIALAGKARAGVVQPLAQVFVVAGRRAGIEKVVAGPRAHGERKGGHQAPAEQLVIDQGQPAHGHALAGQRSHHGQLRQVEAHAAVPGLGRTHGVQPGIPFDVRGRVVPGAFVVQHPLRRQPGGVAQPRMAFQELWRGHGHQPFVQEHLGVQVGVVPGVKAYAGLYAAHGHARAVQHVELAIDAHRQLGLPLQQVADARCQPQQGERRRAAQVQRRIRVGLAAQLDHGLVERLQGLARGQRQARAFACQGQLLAMALEQGHAQVVLQLPDLLADRALGHMQFVGCQREAAVAGHGVEAAQPGQEGGGELVDHCMGLSTECLTGESTTERCKFMNYLGKIPMETAMTSLVDTGSSLWLNPEHGMAIAGAGSQDIDESDVRAAETRLGRFAPLLQRLFPRLAATGGIVESPLLPLSGDLAAQLIGPQAAGAGRFWVKADHQLAVAGSIKARGGFHEVLEFAERVALQHGLLAPGQGYEALASQEARACFARHEVAVGSTGNLGMSIGIMAAALGFRATVHMSSEAKAWKKQRLRDHGVTVHEYPGDYGQAVASGRQQALRDPLCHFVDDEHSASLFCGYAVAAHRLHAQLAAQSVAVDAQHPLFVYIPCGVGGAPGGVCFGLKQVFGAHVHCFFVEPVDSSCFLVRMQHPDRPGISIYEAGQHNRTLADGLAVPCASELVYPLMRSRLSGIVVADDDSLCADAWRLGTLAGLKVEASAAAALSGPRALLHTEAGRRYLQALGPGFVPRQASHIVWTTGGALMPDEEHQALMHRGEALARAARP